MDLTLLSLSIKVFEFERSLSLSLSLSLRLSLSDSVCLSLSLDGKIIKMFTHVITDNVTYIYNVCIYKNYFPKAFKQAKVRPIYKSGDNKGPSNYRPISVLSILSKPLEKHTNKHLLSYLKTNKLIHPSTTHSIPHLEH